MTRLNSNNRTRKLTPKPEGDVVERVAKRSGSSLETVRVFAAISDPANADNFTAAAAIKAFSHVKIQT